ncbi:hypothetical protein D021_0678B, partial [Vibrio parahaemolyticus 10296]
QSASRAQ